MVALAARDEARALGLADLDEILPRQLQRRLGAFRAGGAEIRVGKAAGFAVQHDVRQVLGGLAAERAGMGVGHRRGLPADRGGDALVAVAEARDRRAARAVDDLRAVGEVQVDAVAADRDRAEWRRNDAGRGWSW